MGFTLAGAQVLLRDIDPDDLEDVRELLRDDGVTRWLSLGTAAGDGAERLIRTAVEAATAEPRTAYHLAVTPEDEPERMIGFARLVLGGAQAGELDFAIRTEHQGRGHAMDTSRTLLDFGFGGLGLHRITATVRKDNLVAIKLLKGLGFSPEGVLRDHVRSEGAWHDSILCSLLADERSLVDRF